MDEPITYECTKCGRKFVASSGHTVPVYCCGEKTTKNKKKGTLKKKTVTRTKKK